jgi:hypothetical protein
MGHAERLPSGCQPDDPDGSDHQGERLSPHGGDSPCSGRRAGYATVTVSPRRNALGRGDQAARSRHAGAAGRPKPTAFCGARARRPALRGRLPCCRVSAGRATSANHLREVTAFHPRGGELWFVATARTPPPARATSPGKEDSHGRTSSRQGRPHHRSRPRPGTAARFGRL